MSPDPKNPKPVRSNGGDVGRLGEALLDTARSALSNPLGLAGAVARYATNATVGTANAMSAYLGQERDDPLPIEGDARFGDPAWSENPWFRARLQRWAALRRLLEDLVDLADADGADRGRAEMAVELLVDSLAPSNFAWSNPAVLKRAFETGGRSLLAGAANFWDDMLNNDGRPSQVDTSPFTVGENLACTPGRVVFRNDLIELIQYAPQTDQVRKVPLLFSPPWINKYYILDLAPGRSVIEWAVQHGHTVFAISYRNPDATMRDITMEDYLISGPDTALDVVSDITSSDTAHLVSLCLGGTLSAMLLGYHAAIGVDRIESFSMINAMVDFSDPGPVSVFTDADGIERINQILDDRGVLSDKEMRGTFDLLRARDLVFHYAVNNWLLGNKPPAFDMLAWNADGTNLPATMHSFYLESCYRDNLLAAGELELMDETIDLGRVKADGFILGSAKDHIAPWNTVYQTTQILDKADLTFVQTSGGHIAGIVNPPRDRAWYRIGESHPVDPDQWLEDSKLIEGRSWWQEWVEWLGTRTGDWVVPPTMGSEDHPPLTPAPGTYVFDSA